MTYAVILKKFILKFPIKSLAAAGRRVMEALNPTVAQRVRVVKSGFIVCKNNRRARSHHLAFSSLSAECNLPLQDAFARRSPQNVEVPSDD